MAVNLGEPILLVGDTGSGKTSLVQHIAEMVRTVDCTFSALPR